MDQVDTGRFISIVEQYPAIWDKRLDVYKCRNSTASSWEQVASEVNEEFPKWELPQQNQFLQSLTKKWKNLRDAWRKSTKKLVLAIEEDAEEAPVRPYVFQQELKFLEQVENLFVSRPKLLESEDTPRRASSGTPATTSSRSSSQRGLRKRKFPVTYAEEDGSSLDAEPTPRAGSSGKKNKKTFSRPRGTSVSAEPDVGSPGGGDDFVNSRHFSFFKSLIPSVDLLSEEQILEFQVGVLNLLRALRKRKANAESIAEQQTNGGSLS